MSRATAFLRNGLIALLVMAGLLLGMRSDAANTIKQGTLTITQGSTRVTLDVEVADSIESRAQGLMHRTQLEENAGMLFIFESAGTWSFWMKGTLIPLSLAYIDETWKIVDILDMAVAKDPEKGPFKFYDSEKPARYALEVNQGFFQRKGITIGAQVTYAPK